MNRSLRNPALLGTIAIALSTSGTHLDWRTADQRAAREQLRLRGAVVTVFVGGDVLVHFPLGRHERERRRQGIPGFVCGWAIEEYLAPDEQISAMKDDDLVYLDRLRGLARVNLSGTEVRRP